MYKLLLFVLFYSTYTLNFILASNGEFGNYQLIKPNNYYEGQKILSFTNDRNIDKDFKTGHYRFKRSSEIDQIRGPYNSNKRSRYIELVFVVDNAEYNHLDKNLTNVYQLCKDITNKVNGIYSELNIFLALVGVVVWTEGDEIELSSNSSAVLNNFLNYREEKLIKEYPFNHDHAHLLTRNQFDDEVAGKAFVGEMCRVRYSGGVSMVNSDDVNKVASIVAHEIGHNLGMDHNTNECECPQGNCTMEPKGHYTHWSSCSLEYLSLSFEHGIDYCLRNKPVVLFNGPVCGNGFVEPGEECDCGLAEFCDNTCCDATTCMLYNNASCATGECCDLKTCRPKNAGILCRAADSECDLPEFCTGESEYCPSDVYIRDTEICQNGEAYCYKGSCKTHSDQCELLWGKTGKSSDNICYKTNTLGSKYENCGYDYVNQSCIKCENEDIFCGMLHCKDELEIHRLEFRKASINYRSITVKHEHKNESFFCQTALFDLGSNVINPGLVPDGAKCGEGKMCVDQKCMSVDNLKAMQDECPENCNGNGVCNNLGHCHCKEGFAPPYCDIPGPGGSQDSGPASDPNARKFSFLNSLFGNKTDNKYSTVYNVLYGL